jgi:hypothetical protein
MQSETFDRRKRTAIDIPVKRTIQKDWDQRAISSKNSLKSH